MKTSVHHILTLCALTLALPFFNLPVSTARAGTTIDDVNKSAYGANLGWMDWRGDSANGAVIGEYVCSGYIYAANIGWVSLGSGSPVNGIRYQNDSASDFGVNQDGLGNLRGYAWGANIGWINFDSAGAPKVDLATGKLSGHAYSANCGWISLSNAVAHVQTDTVAPGKDTDHDGIADAWELTCTNTLAAFNATSDTDGDGMTDKQEALADTSPLDAADNLRVLSYTRSGTYNTLWWTSKPTRFYAVQRRLALDPASNWVDYVTLPIPGADNVGFDRTTTADFYRLRAYRPLLP
jgi:hypothetical protein